MYLPDAGLEEIFFAEDAELWGILFTEDTGLEEIVFTEDTGLEEIFLTEDAGLEDVLVAEEAGLEQTSSTEDAGFGEVVLTEEAGLEEVVLTEEAGLEEILFVEDTGLEDVLFTEEAGLENVAAAIGGRRSESARGRVAKQRRQKPSQHPRCFQATHMTTIASSIEVANHGHVSSSTLMDVVALVREEPWVTEETLGWPRHRNADETLPPAIRARDEHAYEGIEPQMCSQRGLHFLEPPVDS